VNVLVGHYSLGISRQVMRRTSLEFSLQKPVFSFTKLSNLLQYETDSNDVRRKFEEHGDIKTFFDLIANRGMVFVTYVCIETLLIDAISPDI